MSKDCSICTSPYRDTIDKLLANGDSLRDIEKTYSLSKSALQRHKSEGHLSLAVVKATPPAIIAEDATLQSQLRDIHLRTLRILEDAESSGDPRTALVAIRECRSNLELLAKIEMLIAGKSDSNSSSPYYKFVGVKEVSRDPYEGTGVKVYLPADGRNDTGNEPWYDELIGKINTQVEREVSAILGSGEIHFEGNSRAGQMAIGQAIAVLRKMCAAAGITPENVNEKAKQASSEAMTQNQSFATEHSENMDGN